MNIDVRIKYLQELIAELDCDYDEYPNCEELKSELKRLIGLSVFQEAEISTKLNSADGRTSYDSTSTGSLIPFFNRNVSEYPTENGAPKFDLVPVSKQKDIMINHARIYAKQEYDRIMELVAVLEKQAADIKRRLDITDMVYGSEYQYQPVLGQCYWLVWNTRRQVMMLVHQGPTEWSSGAPHDYEYLANVRYMGDHTWMEITKE